MRRRVCVFLLLPPLVLAIDARPASASSGERASVAVLSAAADVVLTGRVSRVAVAWEREVAGIYTYVTVDVDRALKGPLAASQVVIKQLGGTLDGESIRVPGQPRFVAGEDVLLFLEVRPRDRTLFTVGLWQGKWILSSNGDGRQLAVQQEPERSAEAWILPLETLVAAVAVAADAIRADLPLNHAPAYDSAAEPFVFDPPARWMMQPAVVNVAGGQSGLPGGGSNEIAAAIAQWNAPGSGLRLSLGQQQPSRCVFVNRHAGDILITFDDPCGEISELTDYAGITWFHFTAAGGATINGTFFGRIVQATISTNESPRVRGILTSPSCFQTLMLHELGHAIGFNHSNDPTAIMYATFPRPCGSGPLSLAPDDLAGLFFAYPATAASGPPTALVSNVQVAVTGTNVLTVSFDASAGALTYRLDFRQSVGGPVLASLAAASSSVAIAIPAGTIGSFNVSVTPLNAHGAGPPSPPVPFTIGGPCTAPMPPQGLNGGVSGGVATVQWNASAGATSYIVQAGSVPGASDLFNGNVGNVTSVSAAGVLPGFRAYVRIVPVGACGQGTATAPDYLVQ